MPDNHQSLQRQPQYLYTIISVAAVLFLLGFFGLLLLQTQQLSKSIKEQVDIIVELVPENNKDERDYFIRQLNNSPFGLAGTVKYTPKEDALLLMSEDLGEDLLNLDLPNPLYDIFTFNVKAIYLVQDSLDAIRTVLTRSSIVSDVYYQENLIEQLGRNIKKISWVLLGISILFVLLALTVIHNTIRLALYSKRFLIKTQELVGATWEFISKPFLRKAIWHGFLSALLAIGFLVVIQFWIQEQLPEIKKLQQPFAFISLFIGLIILGILINWVSTFFAVRKYLKLREDELY